MILGFQTSVSSSYTSTYSVTIAQDISLAKALLALSPSGQKTTPVTKSHGVDILLGGHDHLYYASRGVDFWEGYDTSKECLGTEQDKGDILLVKSGTDFRDLSEIDLELEDVPPGDSIVRKRIIKKITGEYPIFSSSPLR
jgi:5'-nucleotidase